MRIQQKFPHLDVNEVDDKGRTAFWLAVENLNEWIVRAALQGELRGPDNQPLKIDFSPNQKIIDGLDEKKDDLALKMKSLLNCHEKKLRKPEKATFTIYREVYRSLLLCFLFHVHIVLPHTCC